MTTRIYIRARDSQNGRRLVEELIADRVDPGAFTLIGKQIPDGLPVHTRRWRDDSSAALRGALVGTALMLAISLLLLQALPPFVLLTLIAIGAVIGGSWWLRRNRSANLPLSAQQEALEDGELLILADLPEAEAPRLEERVNQRHPELLVLGPDVGGSPPFP
ncbi:hypothetical protein [Halochromatium salexigens]|uniref:DUF1269 domain-containing protein n=1 Tax=Halochromatium salexigens TaxID=49447 RepID=A0AAJ0UIV8_HALSE|nr:hypothetical protein [Halochromatium salexigens]MBK5932299.1 hypothetical protein [Halochromatium salexigens]